MRGDLLHVYITQIPHHSIFLKEIESVIIVTSSTSFMKIISFS